MKSGPQITLATLIKHQRALIEKFGPYAQCAYPNVSMTQLSVARHCGGGTVNGQHFTYIPADDLLVRDDVLKFIIKLEKEAKNKEQKQ